MVTDICYGLGDWGSIPDKDKDFFSSPMGTVSSFLRG